MTSQPIGRTRIKVCGVRDFETARVCAHAGVDAVGFMFVESSPRFIEPESAAEIMHTLPPLVTGIGVVRDLSVDQFCAIEQRCPLAMFQLHGKESEQTVRACGPGVVKAFRFDQATIESQLKRWGGIAEVDAVLIDGSPGGEGVAFDWAGLGEHLDRAHADGSFDKPVFIAGGLRPANVGEAIRALRPSAVDVSSGVESAPGVKDHDAIRAFCVSVREADGTSL